MKIFILWNKAQTVPGSSKQQAWDDTWVESVPVLVLGEDGIPRAINQLTDAAAIHSAASYYRPGHITGSSYGTTRKYMLGFDSADPARILVQCSVGIGE